jgi:hypothetical protein
MKVKEFQTANLPSESDIQLPIPLSIDLFFLLSLTFFSNNVLYMTYFLDKY